MCQGYEERPPYVWEDGSSNGKAKTVGEAIRVLTLIIRQDRLGDGQLVDLNYVREVLKSVQDPDRVDREEHDVKAIINNNDLDTSTQAYLLAFSKKVERKHKLRDVVNAVRMGIRMKLKLERASQCAGDRMTVTPSLTGGMSCLESWNDFDVFDFSRDAPGRTLQSVTHMIFDRRNIITHFRLPKKRVENFLAELEKSYLNNAYHNALHAADVTQGVHVLLDRGMDTGLSDLEVFAVVFAAACHDAGHTGVTNDFLVKTGADVAITYSDRSVNESMHLATTYRILSREDCNFLQTSFSPKQRECMRKMVVETVLATDMANHFVNLSALNRMLEDRGKDVTKWDTTVPLLEAVLHGADLSNTARPRHIALQWTDCVLKEFFLQGDQERRLGREPSPLCDRHSVSKGGSQTGFINFIVRPMFMALTPLCNAEEMLTNMNAYSDYWTQELAREKRRNDRQGKVQHSLRKTTSLLG